MATWTPGMSGADIARLCNEAALIAARRPNIDDGVESVDFDAALERVLAGIVSTLYLWVKTPAFYVQLTRSSDSCFFSLIDRYVDSRFCVDHLDIGVYFYPG